MKRRTFLKGMAALPLVAGAPAFAITDAMGEKPTKKWSIRSEKGAMTLRDGVSVLTKKYQTENGGVLRGTVGSEVLVSLENGLGEAATFHLQNLIAKNTNKFLDGDILTPGKQRDFNFAPVHAGSYLLRPERFHWSLMGEGMALPVIIDEPKSYDVDYDEVAVIQDWRIDAGGNHHSFEDTSFDNRSGRLGQYVTVNQLPALTRSLPAGKRVRLRVFNACLARTVVVTNANPSQQNLWVVARDGCPLPNIAQSISKGVALGAGQSADLVFDMPESGSVYRLTDTRYQERPIAEFKAEQISSFVVRREYAPLPPALDKTLASPMDAPSENALLAVISGGMKGGLDDSKLDQGQHWMLSVESAGDGQGEDALRQGIVNELLIRNDTKFEQVIEVPGQVAQVSGLADYVGRSALVMPGVTVSMRFRPTRKGQIEVRSSNFNHYRSGVRGSIKVV